MLINISNWFCKLSFLLYHKISPDFHYVLANNDNLGAYAYLKNILYKSALYQ